MVLVDTSVWVEHFRRGGPGLTDLLSNALVLMHPFILGELACGTLNQRSTVLSNLRALPAAVSATHEEALRLVNDRRIWGRGIGWIDIHLLASALLENCAFWTFDKRLSAVCQDLGIRMHDPTRRT